MTKKVKKVPKNPKTFFFQFWLGIDLEVFLMADGQIPPVSTPYYDILSLENVHFTFKNNLKCLGVV